MSNHELVDFYSFLDVCEHQDVGLHTAIVDAGRSKMTSQRSCHTPDGMYAAVAEAGLILRNKIQGQISRNIIDIPAEMRADRRAAALANIINATHVPFTSVGSVYFNENPHTYSMGINACVEAEKRFAQTASYMDGTNRQSNNIGYQIIADGDRPVFLRKSLVVPSSLALTNVVVDGIPYPVGSIVRTDVKQDTSTNPLSGKLQAHYPDVPCDRADIIPISSVVKVGFMRMSTFALRAEDVKTAAPIPALWSLEEISDVAQRCLHKLSATVEANV